MAKIKKTELTFAQLRKKNLERVGEIHNCETWEYPEWVMAVCGELGELANILKKVRRGSKKMDDKTKEEIRHEFADVQIYLDLLADSVGVDLGEATREKFNLTSDKYKCKIKL
jgi:NTP pyrophosphatase (non-canonical NTP hydrolase)